MKDIERTEFETLYYKLTNKQVASVYQVTKRTIERYAKKLGISKPRGRKLKLNIINDTKETRKGNIKLLKD